MERFPEYDHWIIWMIIAIASMAFLVLCFILLSRLNFLIRSRRRRKLESTLITVLSGIVNKPEKKTEYIKRIQKQVKRHWERQLLLDLLIEMCYNFTGNYRERSAELYTLFHLEPISIKKLKSSRWNIVNEGIIELSVMGGDEAYELILPKLESKNRHVRRHAKIALVEMKKIEGLMDLKDKIGVLSKWGFISILSIIHSNAFKLNDEQLDELRNSPNESVKRLSEHLDIYSVAHH